MKRKKRQNNFKKYSLKNISKFLGIADNRHTAKIIKNSHSSFGVLFLLTLAMLPLTNIGNLVLGVQTHSGNVSVSLLVPGPPPTVSATILSPTNGTVQASNIAVSGTCGVGLLVKIFNNSTFVGSVFCQTNSTFSIAITLNEGLNNLSALNFDNLDQPGPASPSVAVTLVSGTGQSITPKMIISADSSYRQINPNISTEWKFSIKNGKAPYSAFIDWGDGKNQNLLLNSAGDFVFNHSYSEAGKYTIYLTVTDSVTSQAHIQLSITVNGAPAVPIGPTVQPSPTCGNSNNQLSGFGLLRCNIQSSLGQYWIVLYWLMLLLMSIFWLAALKRRKKESNRSPRRRPIHSARV